MESISRVQFVRAPRFDLLPLWAVAVVVLWCASVFVATALERQANAGGTICMLRATTGVPCPTCGGTRAAMALGRGDVLAAVAFNPMLTIGGAILAAVVIVQLVFRRRLRIELTAQSKRMLWTTLIALFLLNWAYVIARDGPWSIGGG